MEACLTEITGVIPIHPTFDWCTQETHQQYYKTASIQRGAPSSYNRRIVGIRKEESLVELVFGLILYDVPLAEQTHELKPFTCLK